jgi:transcriptional regulator with XRE-family HTH domain
MTQYELADLSGVSRTAIASIEGGTYESTRTKTLRALAAALKVSIADLIDEPAPRRKAGSR